MIKYIVLAILWITWCALHSALISLAVTRWLRKKYPETLRYYRILYNLFAAATLIPVMIYTALQRGDPIVMWAGPWRLIPILLGTAALFFFAAGAQRYDFLQFIGLRQIKDEAACSVLTDDCSLDTGGVLSMVRHPWYSGGLLIIWARPLDVAAILTNLILSAYFVVGANLEEKKLKRQFGKPYSQYQRRVSMFFPLKWAKQLMSRAK
jgi:protein-S-isoprenylcysteine O-methyltransferase Ste14